MPEKEEAKLPIRNGTTIFSTGTYDSLAKARLTLIEVWTKAKLSGNISVVRGSYPCTEELRFLNKELKMIKLEIICI